MGRDQSLPTTSCLKSILDVVTPILGAGGETNLPRPRLNPVSTLRLGVNFHRAVHCVGHCLAHHRLSVQQPTFHQTCDGAVTELANKLPGSAEHCDIRLLGQLPRLTFRVLGVDGAVVVLVVLEVDGLFFFRGHARNVQIILENLYVEAS